MRAASCETVIEPEKGLRRVSRVGGRRGWSFDEIVEVLNDPDNKFTTAPENVMKYVNFMADIGTLKVRPASWKDLFFPEIHSKPGN